MERKGELWRITAALLWGKPRLLGGSRQQMPG
jgi:hypothetical protein